VYKIYEALHGIDVALGGTTLYFYEFLHCIFIQTCIRYFFEFLDIYAVNQRYFCIYMHPPMTFL